MTTEIEQLAQSLQAMADVLRRRLPAAQTVQLAAHGDGAIKIIGFGVADIAIGEATLRGLGLHEISIVKIDGDHGVFHTVSAHLTEQIEISLFTESK